MKKLVSSLLLTGLVMIGASQAQAALLTDWTYNLSSVALENINTDFATVGSTTDTNNVTKDNATFESGSYGITLSPNGGYGGTFGFSGDNTSASTNDDDKLLNQITTDGTSTSTPATKIADLVFTYEVVAVGNDSVKMTVNYSIPLYTYYSAETNTAYVYYNNSEVKGQGATSITHDGYAYGVTGIGLFVDGRALIGLPGAEGDENLYTGWAINPDTINNNYSEYVVGGDNTDTYLGSKGENAGKFEITGAFSITNTKITNDPAPTPEPATMLLTGLGLAGMGFIKRRGKKA